VVGRVGMKSGANGADRRPGGQAIVYIAPRRRPGPAAHPPKGPTLGLAVDDAADAERACAVRALIAHARRAPGGVAEQHPRLVEELEGREAVAAEGAAELCGEPKVFERRLRRARREQASAAARDADAARRGRRRRRRCERRLARVRRARRGARALERRGLGVQRSQARQVGAHACVRAREPPARGVDPRLHRRQLGAQLAERGALAARVAGAAGAEQAVDLRAHAGAAHAWCGVARPCALSAASRMAPGVACMAAHGKRVEAAGPPHAAAAAAPARPPPRSSQASPRRRSRSQGRQRARQPRRWGAVRGAQGVRGGAPAGPGQAWGTAGGARRPPRAPCTRRPGPRAAWIPAYIRARSFVAVRIGGQTGAGRGAKIPGCV
jgi:hypothetical protein